MIATKWKCLSSARVGLGVGILLGAVSDAHAFGIETGNPDIMMRWDNTVRYNLGVRAQDCDVNICGNGAGAGDVTAYQSDRKFAKKGSIVTNRVDLLSEFDFIYKRDSGFRVSGAAWYDAAYSNKIEGDPALDRAGGGAFMGAGPSGGRYANYTKRYNIGPSGEILDAFVFTKFDLGAVPVNVKLGQHNIYWGESLFSAVTGIAYNQGPLDFRKALATPGVEAKEVFMPLAQLSWTAQVTDELSLAGQYFLDWKPSAIPDGGTYFGAADGFGMGGTGTIFGLPNPVTGQPDKKYGDWGLAAKWRPDWLNGNMGFYYREFTNKFTQLTIASMAGGAPTSFGDDFSSTKREKLLGFSLAKQIEGVSVGFDVTYRPDAHLVATPFGIYVPPGSNPSTWVPTGNIATGVLNGIAYFGKNKVFESAVLMAELNYAWLDKVTANGGNYNGVGYNCGNVNHYACQTKAALGINVLFEPKWFEVLPGVNMSMPMSYSKGLHGNSPVVFGTNEGQGSWSLGVAADLYAKYNFRLQYNGFIAKHQNDKLGALSDNNSALGKYWDRDFVSLTFKTAF